MRYRAEIIDGSLDIGIGIDECRCVVCVASNEVNTQHQGE